MGGVLKMGFFSFLGFGLVGRSCWFYFVIFFWVGLWGVGRGDRSVLWRCFIYS